MASMGISEGERLFSRRAIESYCRCTFPKFPGASIYGQYSGFLKGLIGPHDHFGKVLAALLPLVLCKLFQSIFLLISKFRKAIYREQLNALYVETFEK
jgi:hypothetical protein